MRPPLTTRLLRPRDTLRRFVMNNAPGAARAVLVDQVKFDLLVANQVQKNDAKMREIARSFHGERAFLSLLAPVTDCVPSGYRYLPYSGDVQLRHPRLHWRRRLSRTLHSRLGMSCRTIDREGS